MTVDQKKLLSTTDAQVWANEFMGWFGNTLETIDRDVMIGWFANAIETGRAAGFHQRATSFERIQHLESSRVPSHPFSPDSTGMCGCDLPPDHQVHLPRSDAAQLGRFGWVLADDPFLPEITYKPGWSITWSREPLGYRLWIRVQGVDAYTDGPRGATFSTIIDDPWDDAHIRHWIAGIEDHEISEWLRFDGRLVHDPHAETTPQLGRTYE